MPYSIVSSEDFHSKTRLEAWAWRTYYLVLQYYETTDIGKLR